MERLVADTNVYIRAIRDPAFRSELADWQRRMAPQIHQHSVVIAELLAGARDRATWNRWHERWVLPTERVARVVVPQYGCWLRASGILTGLQERGLLAASGSKAGFFNDCLLAATAREQGFVIITYNHQDFERIRRVEPEVRVIAPLP
jgi:predicted nucleic acid-binding protein